MFNHVRTLLLNRDGHDLVPEWALGEEAVSPEYRRLSLHTYLDEIRARLFGAVPDHSMMNYRLAQYLNLIHATELAEFVTALDSRITYLPLDVPELFSATPFTASVLALTNGLRQPAFVSGELSLPDATGRMHWYVNVTTAGADPSFTATLDDYGPPRRRTTKVFATIDGSSTDPVALFNSGYSLILPAQEGSWDAEFHIRPGWDLGQVLATLDIVGEPNLLSLFGPKPTGAYKTFHALFNQHTELAYRLGGIVLAVAYRTEEIRRG